MTEKPTQTGTSTRVRVDLFKRAAEFRPAGATDGINKRHVWCALDGDERVPLDGASATVSQN